MFQVATGSKEDQDRLQAQLKLEFIAILLGQRKKIVYLNGGSDERKATRDYYTDLYKDSTLFFVEGNAFSVTIRGAAVKGDTHMATSDESILFKKAGKVIPKEVVGQVLVNAGGSVGSARIVDGNFKLMRRAETLELDQFMAVQGNKDQLLDLNVLFWLTKRKPTDDELQPRILVEDDGDAILIAFGDGDVDFDALSEIVDHNLGQTGGDLVKTMKVLNGPAVRSEIAKRCWKDRGQITLMDITGEIMHFKTNPLFEEHDWGWISNSFKPPKPAELPATSVPTAGGAAARIAAKAAAAAKTVDDDMIPTKKTAPPDTGTPVLPSAAPGTGPQPDTKIPDAAGQEKVVTLGPPPKHLDNKGKRGWWEKRLGYSPPNYKIAIVTVLESKLLVQEAHRPTEVKDAGKAVEQAVVASEVSTILDPKIIESIKEEYGKSKIKIMNAVEREEFDKKNPSWSMQFEKAIPLEDTFGWDFETVRGLTLKYPVAMANLAYEAIALYQEALTDIEKMTAAPKEPDKKLSAAERIAAKSKAA